MKAQIERDLKRRDYVKKYEKYRMRLKKIIRNKMFSVKERQIAQDILDSLPRDSSKIRVHNRCLLTGRPKGVYRNFGLSRIKLRELALSGKLPGITKASW
jgi:small subunit ribosomal protein S14